MTTASQDRPGGSGLLGEGHREVLARLVDRFERVRAGETSVPRVVVLTGVSGVGKSRIVREFYRHLQEVQPAPGYWPVLPEDDTVQGQGARVDPLPLRKVLGPDTDTFTWTAGALPSFTWWTFDCERTPGGGLADAVAEARPALQVHLLPAMRAKATHLGVGQRVLGQLDTVIARARDAAKEGSVEGLNQAIEALGGAAVPGLGLLLDWTSRGVRAVRQGRAERALEQADVSFGGVAEQSRRTLAEEFADLVLTTVHPQVPAVVVVEDAHLIDGSVREFLEKVSARDPGRPVLVIAAAWPGGRRSNPAYREWRAWGAQHENLEVWEVPDLAQSSLVELLRRAAPATSDQDARTVVSRYPNPLALKLFLGLKSVRRIIDRHGGALPVADLDLSALPVTIKGLYGQRIAELPPQVRDAVIAAEGTLPAGTSTGPYTPGVVGAAAEQALEVAREETVTGLGHAVEDGLAIVTGEWHSFREALLAEVLGEHLDPMDRAELQHATREVLRRHIEDARGDRYFLAPTSRFDVQVAQWLTQLIDRTPQTVEDAVALIATARSLLDAYQYRLAAELLQLALTYLPPNHPDTLTLRNNLASAYEAVGDLGRAIPLFEETLADTERVLGPDHPDTLTSRNNLASAYQSVGELGRAIPLFEAVAVDMARVLGADHPNTLTSRGNLAGAYESVGDLARAIPLYEQTLADRIRVLGPDHPHTLASRNNLAHAYQSVGDLARAIPLFEETLADAVRILGCDHPHTLGSRNNLASAYQSVGDLARAIPLYEQTLADRIRVLGADHPNTLTSRGNLAGAYESVGDLARAIPLFEAVAVDMARVLGADHPNTLTSRGNLAGAYESVGDLARAIPLFEETLVDRIRVLGPDHPDTLGSRNNLASAYQSVGDLARAIPLFEETLVDRIRVLGPDHPDTLGSRNNLASAYQSVGDLARAIPLYEQTLADRIRVLGPDHPHTLASRNNLAHAYQSVGDLARAIPLFEETLADAVRILGYDHPHTLTSRNNLAHAYQSVGDLARAIPLFEETLADTERVLGPDHPNTLVSRSNLAGAHQLVGDLARAIPLFEETLTDAVRVLGPDHPNTLRLRAYLAGAYQLVGDLARAIPLFEETLADAVRVLGPDHPTTLSFRSNLAYTYYRTGDLGRAIPLFEETLADRTRVLGPDHPDTLTSRGNLAGAYYRTGDLGQAIPLFEETLTDAVRVLGPDHPTTLTFRSNLAYAYQSLG